MSEDVAEDQGAIQVDARGMTTHELLLKLREVCASVCGEVLITIALDNAQEVAKVQGFLSMSGYATEVVDSGGQRRLTARGGCSRCG